MRRVVGWALTLVVAFLAMGTTVAVAGGSTHTERIPSRSCSMEDTERNCFMDAGRRGGGAAFWRDGGGHVVYLDDRLNNKARRLAWQRDMVDAGWERWRGSLIDGRSHCYAMWGDTTDIRCWGGYRTTS